MKNQNLNIGINEFARRQVKGNGKTYADGLTFEEIASHGEEQLKQGHHKQGYRDGVIIVQVEDKLLHHFICHFVQISDENKLRAVVTRRRPNEAPYIQIRALNGTPLKNGSVDLILYRHDVLAETDEQTSDTNWELISFHAIP